MPTASPARPTGAAADRRPLAAVLAASVVSATGSALTSMAVPWFVLQSTGSPGKAGLAGACAIVPVVGSALAGGLVVDRRGMRSVSVCSDLLSGAAVAAIGVLSLTGVLQFWMICALMAAAGLCQAPGQTARTVLLPALARRADVPLARAAGWYDSAARCASVVGAAAGGLLIAVLGADRVLLADGASFAVSAMLVAAGTRRMPEARPQRAAPAMTLRGSRAEVAAGIRFVTGTRLLLAMSLLGLVVQFSDQGWSAVLLPADVQDKMGGAVDLGILEALFSLGALAGALAYSAAGARCRRWPLFVLVYLVVGAPRFAVAAGTRTVLPLAVMMTVEGLACGVINPLVATVVFGIVPEQLRARVLAATTAVSLSVAPLGALAAGWLAGSAGLRTALLAVGGLYLAATLCPLIFPVWRQLDQPDTDPGATGDSAGSGAAGNRAAGDRAARALSRRRQPPELPGAR